MSDWRTPSWLEGTCQLWEEHKVIWVLVLVLGRVENMIVTEEWGGQHDESATAGPGGERGGDLGAHYNIGPAQGGVHGRDRGVGRGEGQHDDSAAAGPGGGRGGNLSPNDNGQGGIHGHGRGLGRGQRQNYESDVAGSHGARRRDDLGSDTDQAQDGVHNGAGRGVGRGRGQQQPQSSRRSSSPISRLGRYFQGLDRENLHHIPDQSTFQRQEEFTVDELQLCGLINCGNVCPVISILLCFHRLRIRDQLMDPLLCLNNQAKPTLVVHKILRALPSQDAFSIFLFILSWNKERIGQEIVRASFGDVGELLDGFLSSLKIKAFRDTPVFTKYVLSYQCQSCGDSNVQLEHWAEQFTKHVSVLPIVSNQSENINLPGLFASLLSRPVEVKCPSVMCNNSIKNATLKAIPGMYTAVCVNRLSFDRNDGLRKNFSKLNIIPSGK